MAMISREQLAQRLCERMSPDEWVSLESEHPGGPIAAYNRDILLQLRKPGTFTSMVDEADVEKLELMLTDFLDEHLPDDLVAQKRITLSCLALSFVFQKPLHPSEVVGSCHKIVDGKLTYYCPSYDGPDTICGFCACHPFDDMDSSVI